MRDSSWCFACGTRNPIGLHLHFVEDGDGIRAEFTPGRQYEGYQGLLHGGIVATALDEAMAMLLHLRGREGLTGRLDIRFRQEAPVGRRLVVSARIREERAKYYATEAALALADGTLLAEARATFVRGE
jgi:acyl-coenzyme A thioesterase PaaI-like protein